jgi:hypothetical protein
VTDPGRIPTSPEGLREYANTLRRSDKVALKVTVESFYALLQKNVVHSLGAVHRVAATPQKPLTRPPRNDRMSNVRRYTAVTSRVGRLWQVSPHSLRQAWLR